MDILDPKELEAIREWLKLASPENQAAQSLLKLLDSQEKTQFELRLIQEKVDFLKVGLQFYADPENYDDDTGAVGENQLIIGANYGVAGSEFVNDLGAVAKQFLSMVDNPEEMAKICKHPESEWDFENQEANKGILCSCGFLVKKLNN